MAGVSATCDLQPTRKEKTMKGVLLWLLGVPIPIIILLAIIF
jgi:hypothetical protein